MLKRKRIVPGQGSAAQTQGAAASSSQPSSWRYRSRAAAPQSAPHQGDTRRRRRDSTTPASPADQTPSRGAHSRREDTEEPQGATIDEEDDQPVDRPLRRIDQLQEYRQLGPLAAHALSVQSPSRDDQLLNLAGAIDFYSQAYYTSRGSLRRLEKIGRRRRPKLEQKQLYASQVNVSQEDLDEGASARAQSEESHQEEGSDDSASEAAGPVRASGSQRQQRRTSLRDGKQAVANMDGAFDDSAMFVFCAFVEELTRHQMGDHSLANKIRP